jgi:hypothetical protein
LEATSPFPVLGGCHCSVSSLDVQRIHSLAGRAPRSAQKFLVHLQSARVASTSQRLKLERSVTNERAHVGRPFGAHGYIGVGIPNGVSFTRPTPNS